MRFLTISSIAIISDVTINTSSFFTAGRFYFSLPNAILTNASLLISDIIYAFWGQSYLIPHSFQPEGTANLMLLLSATPVLVHIVSFNYVGISRSPLAGTFCSRDYRSTLTFYQSLPWVQELTGLPVIVNCGPRTASEFASANFPGTTDYVNFRVDVSVEEDRRLEDEIQEEKDWRSSRDQRRYPRRPHGLGIDEESKLEELGP